MQTGFSVATPNPKKPFFKTRTGIVLIFVGVLIGIGVLGFAATTGYYYYKIKTGSADEIAKQFAGGFSKDSSLSGKKASDVEDIDVYIRNHSPQSTLDSAPITILAFIDFECPFCQKSYPVFKEMMAKYGEAVKVIFKHFPLESIHPQAVEASLASSCAQRQGKFWEYYDEIFINKKLDRSALSNYAKKLNLDQLKFETCVNTKAHMAEINQDLKDGIELGVRGTPTYFINSTKIEGLATTEQWDAVLLDQLKQYE